MSIDSLVWILKGSKAGDYAQLKLLANALGVDTVTKQLVFRPWELLLHAVPHATLAGIDRAASDPLVPPWPDLVLTAGRRNELVARWVREASGGKARLVHVGRPWSNPAQFDLVISNRQYLLPAGANVVVNDLPLTDLSPEALAPERARWEAKWADLPRPWIVVLVGGDAGPLVLTPERGRELGERVNARARRSGGSLLVTTSGRTPRRSADALLAAIDVPHFVHRWPAGGENPYRGLLACGDEFVVTADSMSMLAEACATRRPVHLFDFHDVPNAWRRGSTYRWKPLVHRLAMTVGPLRMRRDFRRIYEPLLRDGRIQRLGDTDATADRAAGNAGCATELARTVDRVRALLTR